MAKRNTHRPCDSTPVKLKADPMVDDFAKLAWAIAHPARVRIVRLLIGREACVCGEIVDCLPLAQSTVSQHLKILKDAGLIQGEIEAPKIKYCLNKENWTEAKKLFKNLLEK